MNTHNITINRGEVFGLTFTLGFIGVDLSDTVFEGQLRTNVNAAPTLRMFLVSTVFNSASTHIKNIDWQSSNDTFVDTTGTLTPAQVVSTFNLGVGNALTGSQANKVSIQWFATEHMRAQLSATRYQYSIVGTLGAAAGSRNCEERIFVQGTINVEQSITR